MSAEIRWAGGLPGLPTGSGAGTLLDRSPGPRMTK